MYLLAFHQMEMQIVLIPIEGRRHLYVTDIDGKKTKRISREAGSYYTPVWSPRGDMIAFTKQEQGQFYIGVMEIDGSNERMIAKSFM